MRQPRHQPSAEVVIPRRRAGREPAFHLISVSLPAGHPGSITPHHRGSFRKQKGPSPVMGRWSSRCHPYAARAVSRSRASSRHDRPRTFRGEVMPWAWITAPTPSTPTGRSIPRGAFGPRLPGPFSRCCVWVTRLRASPGRAPGSHLPRLSARRGLCLADPPRCAAYYSRSTSICRSNCLEATSGVAGCQSRRAMWDGPVGRC